MDVFKVHRQLIDDYKSFTTSSVTPLDPRIAQFVKDELAEGKQRGDGCAFFHLYGIDRDDVDYIMETFPIVKCKDVAEQGDYRTKRMILEIHDAMAQAEATVISYALSFDKAGN